MKTLVQNGTIVTADGRTEADILIDGGIIAQIGRGLPTAVDKTIDAKGKYVLPGGIDVHTHLDMPFGGSFSGDDFRPGTIAAAFGGTTCIVDLAIQERGQSVR